MTIDPSLPALEQLPDAFLIALTDYSAISLSGEEQSKYLQGQVTCDVNETNEHSLTIGAHCNAKGKVLSVFRLLNHKGAHLLLQPKSCLAASLAELQKFGVFAKVDISQSNDLNFYALAGNKAETEIQKIYPQVPDNMTPVVQNGDTTLVYLPGEITRYLLIGPQEQLTKATEPLALTLYSSPLWDLIEITEGFPILEQHALLEYVPQMLNLQAINGISFTKGCYLGQETVARMQYLGKNKRALYSLTTHQGTAQSGNIVEQQLGENWRKAGDILTAYRADSGQTYIQAVLTTDIAADTPLRIKEQPQTSLSVATLPYSLAK
ncbi:tRNA-modifying protein YgfZ [Thalassomonas actiniarum]|uniref:tRNA-modifying protein YgfZ n=1 Tax=Thalassomonas actiniarum TaxID=485447 RepID=A0AAE9YRR2_9GAMM|nr:tRNA-modifying protein YgfZ [Thalassomonas actiniarum]WDE00025.1 tRNA-modifying protein YgfZ [Thalassomonas actiniarum]